MHPVNLLVTPINAWLAVGNLIKFRGKFRFSKKYNLYAYCTYTVVKNTYKISSSSISKVFDSVALLWL